MSASNISENFTTLEASNNNIIINILMYKIIKQAVQYHAFIIKINIILLLFLSLGQC